MEAVSGGKLSLCFAVDVDALEAARLIGGPLTVVARSIVTRFWSPSSEYNCQVTVVDPKSRKAAFWQAPVMIVQ